MHIKPLKTLISGEDSLNIFKYLEDSDNSKLLGYSGDTNIIGIEYQVATDEQFTRIVDYVKPTNGNGSSNPENGSALTLKEAAIWAYENGWKTDLPMLPEDIAIKIKEGRANYKDSDFLCYTSKDELWLRYRLWYEVSTSGKHWTDNWSKPIQMSDINDNDKYYCDLLDVEEDLEDKLRKEIDSLRDQLTPLNYLIRDYLVSQLGDWNYSNTMGEWRKEIEDWQSVINNELDTLKKNDYVSLIKDDVNIQGNKTWMGVSKFNNRVEIANSSDSNSFIVNGKSIFNNTVIIKKDTSVQNIAINGNVISDINGSENLTIAGNSNLKSTLEVTGKTTLNNTLNVTGAVTNNSTTLTKGTATFGENSRSTSVSLVSNGIANFRATKINNLPGSAFFGTGTIYQPGVSIYEDAIVLKPNLDDGNKCSDGGIIRFNANSWDTGNYLEIATLDNVSKNIICSQYSFSNNEPISNCSKKSITLMDTSGNTTLISLTLQNVSYGVTPNSGATGKELVTAEWVKTKTNSDNTGMIAFFCCKKDPSEGWLLCDGQAVSRTTYSSLFNKIGIVYGAGDGSTSFNLPNLKNRFLEGETLANEVNKGVDPGLPNITGFIGGWSRDWTYGNGAFYYSKGYTDGLKGGKGGITWEYGFNAARCSSIYGNSSTVQPLSLRLYPYIHI